MKALISVAGICGMLALGACTGSGLDDETRAAIKATLDSLRDLAGRWETALELAEEDTENDLKATETGTSAPCSLCDPDWTLEGWGSVAETGTESYSRGDFGSADRFPGSFSGTRPVYELGVHGWGIWARKPNPNGGFLTLFLAKIGQVSSGGKSLNLPPVSGSAVWIGDVRALDMHPEAFGTPVTGDARIEADFDVGTLGRLDIAFTGFSGGHPDMSWDDVPITNRHSRGGEFSAYRPAHRPGRFARIEGAFYGAGHEGVAGTFVGHRERLEGVFGALRE